MQEWSAHLGKNVASKLIATGVPWSKPFLINKSTILGWAVLCAMLHAGISSDPELSLPEPCWALPALLLLWSRLQALSCLPANITHLVSNQIPGLPSSRSLWELGWRASARSHAAWVWSLTSPFTGWVKAGKYWQLAGLNFLACQMGIQHLPRRPVKWIK